MKRALERLRDDDLPEVVEALRDIIGWPATIILVEHYGGTDLCVPSDYSEEHLLVEIIGGRAAAKLIENFAGERLYMAKLAAQIRRLRDAEIRERYQTGDWSARQLARQYQLTCRRIWQIIEAGDDESDGDRRQVSLL